MTVITAGGVGVGVGAYEVNAASVDGIAYEFGTDGVGVSANRVGAGDKNDGHGVGATGVIGSAYGFDAKDVSVGAYGISVVYDSANLVGATGVSVGGYQLLVLLL